MQVPTRVDNTVSNKMKISFKLQQIASNVFLSHVRTKNTKKISVEHFHFIAAWENESGLFQTGCHRCRRHTVICVWDLTLIIDVPNYESSENHARRRYFVTTNYIVTNDDNYFNCSHGQCIHNY